MKAPPVDVFNVSTTTPTTATMTTPKKGCCSYFLAKRVKKGKVCCLLCWNAKKTGRHMSTKN
jgi:hypothetical protein